MAGLIPPARGLIKTEVEFVRFCSYAQEMSTAEIMAELPKLSRDELCTLAVKVDRALRDRGAIVYNDAYGVFTEADQAALAAQAWELMDDDHGSTPSR
jgi:hypothetical protein